MILHQESAETIAEYLMQIKAIKLDPKKPFTWASGWKSPIYCDNRLTLSYPQIRNYIRQQFVAAIENQYGTPDVIAGVATGAIAHGVLVAEAMGLPFIYVRSSAKAHGMTNLIEGHIEKGQSVVVIEDLVSTGMSSLKAVKALREAGYNVKGMAAIFTYGFDEARESFEKEKCPLITLSDYSSLTQKAVKNGSLGVSDLDSLKSWRSDPSKWGI